MEASYRGRNPDRRGYHACSAYLRKQAGINDCFQVGVLRSAEKQREF